MWVLTINNIFSSICFFIYDLYSVLLDYHYCYVLKCQHIFLVQITVCKNWKCLFWYVINVLYVLNFFSKATVKIKILSSKVKPQCINHYFLFFQKHQFIIILVILFLQI